MPLGYRFSLLTLLLLCYAALVGSGLLSAFDSRLHAWQEQLTDTAIESSVAVIAIDEASLAELGQWPWPRRLHAQLIDQLSSAGVDAIGLDLILAEPSRFGASDDTILQRALQNSGLVALPVAVSQRGPHWQISDPLPALAEASTLGHAVGGLMENGALGRLEAQLVLPSGPLEAFPLSLLRVGGKFSARADTSTTHWYLPGNIEQRLPPTFSYADVLRGRVPMSAFSAKHVLIGVTSQGLAPHYPLTAGSGAATYPALIFNAIASATLLDGSMRRPLSSGLQHGLALLVIATLILQTLRFCRAHSGLCVLGMATATLLLQQWLLQQSIYFPSAAILATLALGWLGQRFYYTGHLRRTLSQLRGESEAALGAIANGVLMVDDGGRISYANPRAGELLECGSDALLGQTLDQLNLRGPAGWQAQSLCQPGTDSAPPTAYVRTGSQASRVVKITASPVAKRRATVLALDDVSSLYGLQRKLIHQANHDALTGLPNRAHMQQHIERRIRHGVERGQLQPMALIFMDFDNFKRINDVLGHSAGDDLLVQLTTLLKEVFSQGYTLARFGGDEFILLAEPASSRAELCAAMDKFITALEQPFAVANQLLHCQCSIGVSLYPQHGQHAEELVRCADLAMYQAKHFNGSQYQFYSPSGSQAGYGLELEHALHQALERGELEVHYQPRIQLDDERPAGAEALLRWRDPQRGLRLPGSFIPAAEELGLMLRINDWVIQRVFRDIRSLHDAGHPPLRISINLSAQQFMQDGLEAQLEQALQELGTPPGWVELEITEDMLMHDFNRASQVIARLRARGLQVSLDDFGTGYSALNYLINLPVDTIKIDQSFIQQLQFKKSGDVTRAIVQLARDLGFSTVAEGAETGEQVDFLRDIGCDEVQGFFYSKALPLGEFQDYLASVH